MVNSTNDLKNYYEVLEIPSNAKSEEIYHSYQRAKAAYSNDSLALYSLISQEECKNILSLIDEAYSILSDPSKRKMYDEARGLNREFNPSQYINSSLREDKKESVSTAPQQEQSIASMITSVANERDDLGHNSSVGPTSVNKLVAHKRFALDYVINADFEKEIEDTVEFTGEFLRKIREYKNLDIDRLSDMTKVSRTYLQGIENEDFSKLPAPVYVRGFVFQYAKCLKLQPEVVANSYLARMKKIKQ